MDNCESRKFDFFVWMPALLYMIFIYYLSSKNNFDTKISIEISDKLVHMIIYGGLTLAVFFGANKSPLSGFQNMYSQTFSIVALYGAFDEFHQSFVPGRSADVLDWLADVVSSFIVILFIYLFNKYRGVENVR